MPRLAIEDRYFSNPMKPYKEYKRIIYEPGRITRIKLNRPRYLNAQSHAMFAELEDAFDRASDNPDCHVIVLSGEGSCYSSGDDNTGLTPESAPCLVTDETVEELMKRFGGSEKALWHAYNIEHDYYIDYWFQIKLPSTPKPTVSMVHGWCIYGAYATATAMDVVFASEDALFLGGGVGRAMWDIPPRKVIEILYENRFVTAREALELGLINRVFPNREILEKETLAFAERVAGEVPAALGRTKQAYLQALDCQGYRAAYEANVVPTAQLWRQDAMDGHAMRYEGRGRARSPVGLYNLASKLISEGQEVPKHLVRALERAAARDDKGRWQQVLRDTTWRDPERVRRTESSAKAWEERLQKEGITDIKERIRELLPSLKR